MLLGVALATDEGKRNTCEHLEMKSGLDLACCLVWRWPQTRVRQGECCIFCDWGNRKPGNRVAAHWPPAAAPLPCQWLTHLGARPGELPQPASSR